MVAQLSARQSKRLSGHQHCGSKSGTSQLLAIATMAFEHGDWLGCAFVTNRAASAAAGERNLHERFLASVLSSTIGFSDAMRSSREAWSSGYSLKNPSTQFVLTTLPLESGTSYRGRL